MNPDILDNDLLNLANDIIVTVSRFSEIVDEPKIEQFVDFIAKMKGCNIAGARRDAVLRKVKASVFFSKPYDFSIFAEEYRPWFDDAWRQSSIHPYWDRYRAYLLTDRELCLNHVQSLDKITSAIVDHLENPRKPGPWSRRGMVVGQVQSGKTANYIGVVSKAADSGYKFIVVMAGMLNALRNQTQRRFDEGFIGKVTAGKSKGDSVGVGLVPGLEARTPIYLTTAERDFRKTSAETVGLSVGAASEPIILVIKKNATTLRNLTEWIRTNNSSETLKSLPFLLIDDEADNASINVRSPENDPTRINGQIRTLLKMFGRNCYLGYTATPFANIFIDPDGTDEAHGDDLFPRDFILTLDAPDTYMGPQAFFGDDSQDLVRSIQDVDETDGAIPIRHKKDFVLADLPESLEDALHVFVLARTIRMLRGERDFNCSALVNASRFRAVHAQLNEKITDAMDRIRDAALAYASLDDATALSDPTIARFNRLFSKEFSKETKKDGIEWTKVKETLPAAVSGVDVLTVNSDSTAKSLDYTRENWPHGRCVVVVGGMSLSRGLTLEGLVTSYYLRNSIAYDTLMQMGRWFGYRPGYTDLCRVYMTDLCQDWYAHISMAIEELMDDFRSMESWNLTPREFGLRVRAHPDAMIVTARNKMRTAERVTVRLNYFGRLVETTKLSAKSEDHESNRQLLARWIETHGIGSQSKAKPERGWLWEHVPVEDVLDFVSSFKAHPLEELDKIRPVCKYVEETPSCAKWDVLLVSRSGAEADGDEPFRIAGTDVIPYRRFMTGADAPNDSIESAILVNGAKRRLGYARQERAGLLRLMSESELSEAENTFLESHKAVTGNLYRSLRKDHGGNPLMIIHVVSSNNKGQSAETAAFRKNLVALSWSFPGDSRNAPQMPAVEYDVNKVWYKNYIDQRSEETDEFDDDEEMGEIA